MQNKTLDYEVQNWRMEAMLLKRPGDVQGPSTIFKIQNYKLLIGAKQHSRFKILYSRFMKNNTKFLIPNAKQKSRFRTLEVENRSYDPEEAG